MKTIVASPVITRPLGLAATLLLLMSTSLSAQLIVGHRGASHDAPENTLAAFHLAWEQGADAIEGDFYLTGDGKIICHHDKDTKRTGKGGPKVAIAKSTLELLRTYDVGTWKHEKYAGEKMPTLSEVLAVVPEGKIFLIEIKCGPEIVPALKQEILSSGILLERLRVIAFDSEVIAATKEALPELKAYWLTSFKQNAVTRSWSPSIESIVSTLKSIKADGLDCKAELKVVDEAFVKALREAGMEFHVWTVNDPATAKRLQELGVDSITTDRPAYLREMLTGK